MIIQGQYLRCCHHDKAHRVHPVHLMNIEQYQAAANPQTRPIDTVCESVCMPLSCQPSLAGFFVIIRTERAFHFQHFTDIRRLSMPWQCSNEWCVARAKDFISQRGRLETLEWKTWHQNPWVGNARVIYQDR